MVLSRFGRRDAIRFHVSSVAKTQSSKTYTFLENMSKRTMSARAKDDGKGKVKEYIE